MLILQLVEECEERLDDEMIEKLIGVVRTLLPPPPGVEDAPLAMHVVSEPPVPAESEHVDEADPVDHDGTQMEVEPNAVFEGGADMGDVAGDGADVGGDGDGGDGEPVDDVVNEDSNEDENFDVDD